MHNSDNIYVKMPIVCASTGVIKGFELLLRRFRGISLEVFNRNPELYTELSQPMLENVFDLDRAGLIRAQGQSLFINMTVSQFICTETLEFLRTLYFSHQGQNESNTSDYFIENIIVEITEQELNVDWDKLTERKLLLKSLGFKFAIDDFGIKASNFQRVFEFEPDIIKLDREIIVRCNSDKNPLKHLVNLCHNLNKKVIIEGVETEQQFIQAKECQADYLQGYYFGFPEKIKAQ